MNHFYSLLGVNAKVGTTLNELFPKNVSYENLKDQERMLLKEEAPSVVWKSHRRRIFKGKDQKVRRTF